MDDLFKKLGLTEKQGIVYLASLELGSCTMTELSQRAKLKRPTCYLIVDELIILGLLTQMKRGKRKFYQAVHPRRVLEIAKTREREIEQVFPKLLEIRESAKDLPKIHTLEYSYTEGVDELFDGIMKSLQEGREALAFTDMKSLYNFPNTIKLYKKMLRQLKDPHIRELVVGDDAGKEWLKELKPYQGKNHFTKILPPDLVFHGTDNLVFDDKVVICSLQREIFITVIESQNIADTYRVLFDSAWKLGGGLDEII